MAPRIVLVGAGSAQFGFGTISDIIKSHVLVGSTVVLLDINPESLERVRSAAQDYISEHGVDLTLVATTDRADALRGADFVIISIEVGDRFELWEQDWNIPLQYGIRQIYGENGGPGGLFHSLRIVPPILDICADIQTICPEAHVFNFSNPMTRICQTVSYKYPNLRFYGLCHEIASIPMHLPRLLGRPFESMRTCSAGLNHFSVLLSCVDAASGDDLYPEIRAKAPAYFSVMPTLPTLAEFYHWREPGPDAPAPPLRTEEEGLWGERGVFREILSRFGYLPITTDSHFGEYINWAASVCDHEGIREFYEWYKVYTAAKVAEMGVESSGERIIPMIEGILAGDVSYEMAVNVPNKGLITNLPDEVVVEVPAMIDAEGVQGVAVGDLPPGVRGLMLHQVPVLDMTARAIIEGSKELAFQALLLDPVVGDFCAAERMFKTMLKLQSQYLSYLE